MSHSHLIGLQWKFKILVNFEYEFAGVFSKWEYSATEWKIQVGNYKTRLDADKAINKIREKFYGAIVIPIGN